MIFRFPGKRLVAYAKQIKDLFGLSAGIFYQPYFNDGKQRVNATGKLHDSFENFKRKLRRWKVLKPSSRSKAAVAEPTAAGNIV